MKNTKQNGQLPAAKSNAEQKQEISERFGKHAEGYARSVGHAQGPDLVMLVTLLNPQTNWRVLDVATGAGHTAAAIAPFVSEVVASDLSAGMIDKARSVFAARALTNVSAIEMDAENLEFDDESFDAATSRIAPHHFLDIDKAISELARVLVPGGVLVIEDNIAPENEALDQFINELEKQRDSTHVRSYKKSQWKEMLGKHGLRVVRTRRYSKKHDMADWIGRTDLTETEVEALYETLAQAPRRAKKHFSIEIKGGKAVSFCDNKVILKAIKQ